MGIYNETLLKVLTVIFTTTRPSNSLGKGTFHQTTRHFTNKRETGGELTFAKTSGTDQCVSSNDPRNNCGTHFGTSPLIVSKVANANISPVSVMESWVAKTEECRRSRDRRRAFLFGLIHHLSSLRHRSHCLSFFFFHFQVTYVALGLLNHNRDLVGNSVLDCLRGKASLFLLTQFKLNNVYHLVVPS